VQGLGRSAAHPRAPELAPAARALRDLRRAQAQLVRQVRGVGASRDQVAARSARAAAVPAAGRGAREHDAVDGPVDHRPRRRQGRDPQARVSGVREKYRVERLRGKYRVEREIKREI